MTIDTTPCEAPETAVLALDDLEGWQALASTALGRLLSDTELAAVERLPTELALDLLFPALPDEARHEALWALG
jgi:hypothetical protein